MFAFFSNSLRKPSAFTVVMGTMNVTVRGSDTLVYSVKKLTVHKRYNSNTVQNDIALLKVCVYSEASQNCVKLLNKSLLLYESCGATLKSH